MKRFVLQLLTWYHGQTLGTMIFTWRGGLLADQDKLAYVPAGSLRKTVLKKRRNYDAWKRA